MQSRKIKTCRQCKAEFMPWNSTQTICSTPCAIEHARALGTKRDAKSRKAQRVSVMVRKNALKTRSQWLREAQQQFNRYIRLRDAKDPCISCQRHHEGQYHAGHYMTAGGFPELRFNEDNCSKQCSPCNNHLSGNIAAYRINLVKKIGQARVESLEGPHDSLKLTIDEIKEIKAKYRDKAKELD